MDTLNTLKRAAFINNAFALGNGDKLVVQNPANESVVAELNGVSLEQVEAAIMAARRAFDGKGWSDISMAARAVILRRFTEALAARTSTVADLVVAEAGCPRNAPVMYVQAHVAIQQAYEIIDLFLSLPEIEDNPLPLRERVNPFGQVMQSFRRYAPIGVVSAIAAYNFPFFTAFWKVLPALMAGNTMVLRPSPLTPLSAMIFAEAAQEANLPPGVLNVIIEGGIPGAHLMTTHAAVDMVAFTGSTLVGSAVMAQAAPTLKRLQLELGGKSAQIFMPEAINRVAGAVAGACTAHAGQGCSIGTRILVPESMKAEAMKAVATALEKIKVGDTEDATTGMGPVISAAQRARCEHYVKAAVEAGARVVTGGKRPAHLPKGFYFEPTLLDVPDNSNPAAQDEIFGPVISIIGYRDVEHAIEIANDSKFGLSGYVHGPAKEALAIAARLKTGSVNVNGGGLSAYVSSGGQRLSGIGRERGIEGLRLYQNLTCINIGA